MSREYFQEFLTYLVVEKGLAANTIESYRHDLDRFRKYLEQKGRELTDVERLDLVDYLKGLYSAGYKPASIARGVASLRSFFRFLAADGHIRQDPAELLESPRRWQTLPKYLRPDEVDRLLAQADPATPAGLRDKAMLELLYATGLRVSELVKVKVQDLNLQIGYMTCLGKGSKERIIPVGNQARDWIQKYIREGRNLLLKEAGALSLPEPSGQAADPAGLLEDDQAIRPEGGDRQEHHPAPAAAFLRHPPAGAGGRPALAAADARPRGHLDDPDLHLRHPVPIEGNLQEVPPSLLIVLVLVIVIVIVIGSRCSRSSAESAEAILNADERGSDTDSPDGSRT